MDERLTHGHAAHLADPLVVPEAKPLDGLLGEAPRLTAVKLHCQHAPLVHLDLEALEHILRAEDAVAQGAKGLGGPLDARLDVVVVGEVVVEERAEVNEGEVLWRG